MKKVLLTAVITAMLAMGFTSYAQSPENVTIKLNGEALELDSNAYIKNDCTMVPVRGIFEKAANATVNWDEATKTVMIAKSEGEEFNFIFLQIGTENAFVNSEAIKLDAPAEISNNRTMVPLRFIMEQLGCEVGWEQETYTVNITTAEKTSAEEGADSVPVDSKEE